MSVMWKRNKPSSFHETKGKPFKEKVEHHCLVSGSHGTDASKEHKSDLTIEKGNPISHRGVYIKPPVLSKVSRPRSPNASDMDVMSKRPAIISERPKPSILYHSPFIPLEPNQQSLPSNMFSGVHSSGDNYITCGSYLIRTCSSLNDSLSRSSISGYQRSETNITNPYTHHGSTSLINASEVLSCKWENSVPFRPSFSWPKFDSPQTLYDPLVDSINPPDNADSEEMKISPENSPAAASNNLSGIGENSPDYNQSNNLHKVKEKMALLEEASIAMNSRKDRTDSDRSRPARSGNGELAEFKMFRVALAEFIKELVKPAWKNGLLTIDEHRILLKRASDKIISSVHPHQVPNTHESVKQYISMYRPKIEKLVEGYLEMYSKRNRRTKQDNEVSCIGSSA